MKNNKLHIQYNASLRTNIRQDTIESIRCTSIDSAKKIVQGKQTELVKIAQWKDAQGKLHDIVDVLRSEPKSTPTKRGCTKSLKPKTHRKGYNGK